MPTITQTLFAVLPDPESIRRTAREVIQRPDYRFEPIPDRGATFLDLIVHVIRWILSPFLWLFNALEGIPDWLRWFVVLGLAVLLVLLIGHIAYTLVIALRGPRRMRRFAVEDFQRSLDPAGLEQEADKAAEEHDFITAIRLLFRACLLRLAQAEKRTFRPGVTNREYLHRYRSTSLFESLALFVRAIDTGWYGGKMCVRTDYEACRNAHGQIRQLIIDRANAHGT